MVRSKGDYDALSQAAHDKSSPMYMKSYGELKDYYQDKYGNRGWMGALAQAIAGSDARSGKEYLAARRAVERREAGTHQGFGKEYTAKVPEVGKQLPPTHYEAKGGQVSFTIRGEQQGRGERDIKVTLRGDAAYDFVNNPSYDKLWSAYGVAPELFDDGDYALDITSIS